MDSHADGKGARLEIQFQNENLCAWRDGRVVTIVPDLIVVVDRETAESITTEGLRYGQRVSVIGVSAPPTMRTAAALAVFGPQAFPTRSSVRAHRKPRPITRHPGG